MTHTVKENITSRCCHGWELSATSLAADLFTELAITTKLPNRHRNSQGNAGRYSIAKLKSLLVGFTSSKQLIQIRYII